MPQKLDDTVRFLAVAKVYDGTAEIARVVELRREQVSQI